MATPMTIKQEKFQALKHQFDDRAQIIGLPCEGLMEFVERGELRGSAVEAYLTAGHCSGTGMNKSTRGV